MSQAKENFEQYWRYSTHFRNWVMAYGAGMIYLIVKAEGFFGDDMLTGIRGRLLLCCWIAVAIQVGLALFSKFCNYGTYCVTYQKEQNEAWLKRANIAKSAGIDFTELEPSKEGWCCSIFDKLNDYFLIDVIIDLATVTLLGFATVLIFVRI